MAGAGEKMAPALSSVRVNWPVAVANRVMGAVHAALVAAVIGHRAQQLLVSGGKSLVVGHGAMVVADLTLLFLWALSQSGLWRPVSRVAFPERLASRGLRLPGVDVLVVTADPDKEPALGVMNTVLSAMALDYPGERLSVYLSDDAGSPLTLLAARKAYAFARAWVPFCRTYSVHCPCPDRYFFNPSGDLVADDAAAEERLRIKKMYETFKGEIEEACRKDKGRWTKEERQDHDAHVEVISNDGDQQELPSLVYVSREKRRRSPHHFKAGALNALLRVSALLTNAPYVLVLDCDMACNSRASALEAMCFHLDPSPPEPDKKMGFVQFPQMFHNLSHNDIYTNDLRHIFATRWIGLDGLRGPLLSGTGFYARRDALYGDTELLDATELARRFGHSDQLVASVRNLHADLQQSSKGKAKKLELELLEAVASCSFEAAGTGWGDEVGFMYQSVIEDYFTGYRRFFCRGWTSAYCYPAPSARPPFLGSVPTNLNDVLVQNKRWMSGMLAVGLSSTYCPLACRELLAVSVPQAMAIAYFGFLALYAIPALCYATLPQLCFLRGVPLFCPWYAAAFASSQLQHLVEASVANRRLALRTWWNEQRFWMLNAVTAQLFGCVSAAQDLLGVAAIDFDLTSKASDATLYHRGVFDFTGCSTLLLPATTLCVLNAAALVGGTWRRMMSHGGGLSWELFPQLFLLSYIAALSYPLLEGMFLRRDPARVPGRITALSVALAAVLLALFSG
ncbi:hypothetical protein HU200_065670 [Digitaria exilis]|uniref:Uncharacterized protein n=1 Tax=Digitaria exilis TaxID=1010633 RepID=A0A835A3M5_9POAL|nr:hypothetical protein HU200_065670 [Digitaria exilis]CAB3479561.1 unnamed protein product [Digitaria exilis]